MALQLLLLLGFNRLEEYNLLLVDRQLLLKTVRVLCELLNFRLVDTGTDSISVRIAEE